VDPSTYLRFHSTTWRHAPVPNAAIRAKVDPADGPGRRTRDLQGQDYKAVDFKGFKYTIQVRARRLHGLQALCRHLSARKDKSNPKHKAIDMSPAKCRFASPSGELQVLPLTFPSRIGQRSALTSRAANSLLPLFEYSGAVLRLRARRRNVSCSRSSSAIAP